MQILIRQITSPTETDIVRLAEVAAASFARGTHLLPSVNGIINEPCAENCIVPATGGNLDLNVPFHVAQVRAIAMEGTLYVAEDKDDGDRIIGVSGWFAPGVSLFCSDAQQRLCFAPYLAMCPANVQKWWMEYFLVVYSKATETLIDPGSLVNACHLQLLATLPECQGKGVGSALVRDGLERAFGNRQGVYLETQTDTNVSYNIFSSFLSLTRCRDRFAFMNVWGSNSRDGMTLTELTADQDSLFLR
ncbi:hypothetical protein FB451DRAFT_1231208 [Mycena latifolia]|nr:hypothetical protein FB451DRAFT_1231208 [Mycena latifolia]